LRGRTDEHLVALHKEKLTILTGGGLSRKLIIVVPGGEGPFNEIKGGWGGEVDKG